MQDLKVQLVGPPVSIRRMACCCVSTGRIGNGTHHWTFSRTRRILSLANRGRGEAYPRKTRGRANLLLFLNHDLFWV